MIEHYPEYERFADELARLRGRMRSLYGGVRTQTGLNDMELTVLTAVANAKTAPTVAQIGRSLGHPRQMVQRATNHLVELGYVTLTDNPDHKRASLLRVSPAGEAVKEVDRQQTGAITAALHQHVNAARFGTAADLLHTIRTDIEAFLRKSADD